MFGYTTDFDRTFDLMDQLRHRMERVFDDFDGGRTGRPAAGQPATNLYDTGKALVLELEVPGLSDKDFDLTLTQNVLTVSARRQVSVPEGYSVHRRERQPFELSRSYSLPSRVDPDKCSADLSDGVLTITLEKAAEVRPRQISIKVK
jgi:HSP20 family protein